jgi:hypothetical protein
MLAILKAERRTFPCFSLTWLVSLLVQLGVKRLPLYCNNGSMETQLVVVSRVWAYVSRVNAVAKSK